MHTMYLSLLQPMSPDPFKEVAQVSNVRVLFNGALCLPAAAKHVLNLNTHTHPHTHTHTHTNNNVMLYYKTIVTVAPKCKWLIALCAGRLTRSLLSLISWLTNLAWLCDENPLPTPLLLLLLLLPLLGRSLLYS